MQFVVSSAELAQAIALASKVISPKAILPAMQCLHFDVGQDELRLTATNGEMTITSALKVGDVSEVGKFCISADRLQSYTKSLPTQPLTFDVRNESVKLKALTGTASMPAQSAEEFQAIKEVVGDQSVFILARTIAKAINLTQTSMHNDPLRPVMNGIYLDFDSERKTLNFVATDTKKLASYEMPFETSIPNFLLHRGVVPIIKEIIAKADGDASLKITEDEKNVTIVFGQTTLTYRKTEGVYVPYRSIMSAPEGEPLIIDVKSLTTALNRTSVYGDEAHLALFDISENSLRLSAQNLDFSCSAEETLPCTFDRQVKIAFNSKSLLDVLGAFNGSIKVFFSDPNKPAVIIPDVETDEAQTKVIILPMRI